MIRKIVVPTDFSQLSLGVVDFIRSGFPGAEIVLLHVLEAAPPLAFPIVDGASETSLRDEEAPVLRELTAIASSLAGRAGMRVVAAVRRGDPAHEIGAAALEEGADLIVLATHGRTGLAHVFLGSVAEKTVRLSTVPVLTVRPAGFGRAPAAMERLDGQLQVR